MIGYLVLLLINSSGFQSEYFQDDIFPRTRVTWKPTSSSEEWFKGCSKVPETFDLKPSEMENLSDAPAPPITPKRVEIPLERQGNMESSLSFLIGGRQQEKLIQSMSGKVNCLVSKELPQKSLQGVGDEEWVRNLPVFFLFFANFFSSG